MKAEPSQPRWILVLSATIKEVDKPRAEAIVAHLRQISGDASLTLQRIEEGSVKLVLEGSQDGFKRIESLFKAGQLNEIVGIPVQNVQYVIDFQQNNLSEILTHSLIRILLIADNPEVHRLVFQDLQQDFPNFEIEAVTELESLFQSLSVSNFDLVVLDDQLQWSNGLKVIRVIKEIYPDQAAIMLISSGNEEIIPEAMKAGVDDYVIKSFRDSLRLSIAVQNVLKLVLTNRKVTLLDMRLQRLNQVALFEIRNPLNVIINCIRLVSDGLCDDRDEEMEFIKRADETAIYLLGIINDFFNANIKSINFEPARLSQADFINVDIKDANFSQLSLQSTNLEQANPYNKTPSVIDEILNRILYILFQTWQETGFGSFEIHSEKIKMDRIAVTIQGSTYYRYIIAEADFRNVDIKDANFSQLSLQSTNLEQANPYNKTPSVIDEILNRILYILFQTWQETGFGSFKIHSEKIKMDRIAVTIQGSTYYRYIIAEADFRNVDIKVVTTFRSTQLQT